MSEINHSSAPTPPETPEQSGGILRFIRERINWPATLAVSAVATIGASVALHEIDFPEGSAPEAVKEFLTPDIGTNYQTSTESRYTRHHTIVRRERSVSAPPPSNFYLDKGSQKYARDFSHDPQAGEYTNPHELDAIVSDIAGNVKLGYDVRSIKITGYASAEDNGPDGGLTTPSEKNARLAQKRASTVEEDLRQAMNENPELAKAAPEISFSYGNPVEQDLTQAQAAKIDKLARKAGYSDAKQLVDAWNTGQAGVPESDRELLSRLLGSARKVNVHVTYAERSKDIIVEKKYCMRYDITAIHTHSHHQKEPLPLPLPILIPVPFIRRGKKGNDEAQLDDEPIDSTSPDESPINAEPATDTRPEIVSGGNSELPLRIDRLSYEPGAWSRRLPNVIAGSIGGLLLAGALFVNVSGENCHGDGHTPRPLLVDLVWESIDDGTNRGADVSQTISLGIPFVSSAQIDLSGNDPGNIWGFDGQKACESSTPATTGPVRKPACSQVDIVRRNGKTVSKRTVYQAPPLSTKHIIKQHR
ncbi:MAG TPA: hypothetical protein VHB72_01500 [Candidatus Saccharimonadales bacterium]|nr:hypothetical protein [Candidatus Saccharimonadales bacterium]